MLLRAGFLSLGLLLISRVLGLLRESALAASFGTSGMGDVIVMMLTLPDWLASMVSSGALAYVLLPVWARQSREEQRHSRRQVSLWLLGVGMGLALALVVFARPVYGWLLPGVGASLRSDTLVALWFSAIATPLALLSACWSTSLQHERDFVGMYFSNVLVNLTVILALVVSGATLWHQDAVEFVGAGLLVAMALRLLWLGYRMQRRLPAAAPDVAPSQSQCARTALPGASVWVWAVLVAGLPLAFPFVARSMASSSGEGAAALFNYAWKLIELPLVLAVQLVATLSFPVITRAFAGEGDVQAAIVRAFSVAWTLAVAAAAALMIGAPAYAQVLFGWGKMSADGLVAVGRWSSVGAWSLLPQALTAVALTVLATVGRIREMAWVYTVVLALLLLGAPMVDGDGIRLMTALNMAYGLIAVAAFVLLGDTFRRFLPSGLLISTSVALVAVAVTKGLVPDVWWSSNYLLAIAWSVLVAIFMIVIAVTFSPALRLALRRAS